MRTLTSSLLIALVTAAQVSRAAEEAAQQPLKGTWIVVSGERNGKPDDDSVGNKLVFDGSKVTTQRNTSGRSEEATFSIDTKSAPSTIDIKAGNKPPILGIYELSGDQLKICFRGGDAGRPAEFSAKLGSCDVLIMLDREKR